VEVGGGTARPAAAPGSAGPDHVLAVPPIGPSNPARPKLRLGLLLEGEQLPRFGLEVIQSIASAGFAQVDVLIHCPATSEATTPSSWAFERYRAWDNRRTGDDPDPLEPVGIPRELAGAQRVGPEATHVPLDVVLDFRTAPRAWPVTGRCGVWSVERGDRTRYRGGPEGLWEIIEGTLVTGGELNARDAGPEVLTLARCQIATRLSLSWARNRRAVGWAVSALMTQKLWELHVFGWDHLKQRALPPGAYAGARGSYGAPTNWEVARWLGPALVEAGRTRLTRRANEDEWHLALRESDRLLPDRAGADATEGFRLLPAASGRWYADPFLVSEGGRRWVFFEDADRSTGFGRLSAAPVENGAIGEARPVLERPYHLSYPCVFNDGGQWYMVPETSANGTVELYRCTRFPDSWTLERVMLRGHAVDSTVWIDGGRYWLFTTLLERHSRAMQLWLFHADSLAGPWRSHPSNPISMDVRDARGAGAIFRHNGRLFRPSQDCSGRYGRSFSLNEIVVLTPSDYAEARRITVEPSPGFVGTHTYGRLGNLELIDACAHVRRRRPAYN
jgi:hypothetical protein